jgi:hypothetical protein
MPPWGEGAVKFMASTYWGDVVDPERDVARLRHDGGVEVTIVATALPPPVFEGHTLLVGMHRGRDVVTPRPLSGDVMRVRAALEVVLTAGGVDFRGPWVHGRSGGRFLYLCWGYDAGMGFVLQRRATLSLGVLDPAEMASAAPDAGLEGRLSLVDARGEPVCAAVRPPWIRWSLRRPSTATGG